MNPLGTDGIGLALNLQAISGSEERGYAVKQLEVAP